MSEFLDNSDEYVTSVPDWLRARDYFIPSDEEIEAFKAVDI